MSYEKSKQAFRKGATSAVQTSRVRLSPDVAELKAGDGIRALLADLINLLKRLHAQALALGDPGLNQVVTIELDGLRLPDVTLCDVDVEPKKEKMGAKPKSPLPPPLDTEAQRQLEADAVAILTERAQGKFSNVEDVMARIGTCNNQEHLRRLLFNVKKSWSTSKSGDSVTAWGGLDGIRDYLPTGKTAVFDGVIREVGTGRRRIVLLELTGEVDEQWREAVDRSTQRATDYLELRYASRVVGERLTHLHALGLPVRVDATVREMIKPGAPADFCIANAYPWNVTDDELQLALQKMGEKLRGAVPEDLTPPA